MTFLNADRLLAEAELEPIQGSRFQPTGFPSLGPAEFTSSNEDGKSTNSLLVESAQSMANRLEKVCMDDEQLQLVKILTELPVITVEDKDGKPLTNSILESHRMASSYILKDKKEELLKKLKDELDIDEDSYGIDIPKFAEFVFKYDTSSILHGLFLADKKVAGGRYKLTRVLSSFIEATDVKPIVSGGVKLDHLDPTGKKNGGSKEGYGHIPFSRTEYVAESIKVYFNIDLALIRSYNLSETANDFLFTFALWKIQTFLKTGLRLRTACDLKLKKPLIVTSPENFDFPDLDNLTSDLKENIKKCKNENLFCESPIVIKHKA